MDNLSQRPTQVARGRLSPGGLDADVYAGQGIPVNWTEPLGQSSYLSSTEIAAVVGDIPQD